MQPRSKVFNFFFVCIVFCSACATLYVALQSLTRNLKLQGQILPQAAFVLCLAFSLSFLSWKGLRAKEFEKKAESFLVVCSVLFAVYAAEFLISFVPWLSKSKSLPPEKSKILAKIRAEDIHLFITPAHFLNSPLVINNQNVIPLAGVPNIRTWSCNENAEEQFYTHDRYGFHNSDLIWEKNSFDIALVGDSFTYGTCVAQSENIAGQLQDKGFKVLNLGFPDRGPLLTLGTVREYAKDKQIKNLIWFHYEGNDTMDMGMEFSNPLIQNYYSNPQFTQGLAKNPQIEKLMKERLKEKTTDLLTKAETGASASGPNFKELAKSFLSLQQIRLLFFKLFKQPRFHPEVLKLKDVILHARKEALEFNRNFIFVYLPSQERYANAENIRNIYTGTSYRNLEEEKEVLSLLKKEGITTIDMHEWFTKDGDPLKFFPNRKHGHYTAEGYALVAKAVAKALQSRAATR